MVEENPQDLCRLLLLLIFHEKNKWKKLIECRIPWVT